MFMSLKFVAKQRLRSFNICTTYSMRRSTVQKRHCCLFAVCKQSNVCKAVFFQNCVKNPFEALSLFEILFSLYRPFSAEKRISTVEIDKSPIHFNIREKKKYEN